MSSRQFGVSDPGAGGAARRRRSLGHPPPGRGVAEALGNVRQGSRDLPEKRGVLGTAQPRSASSDAHDSLGLLLRSRHNTNGNSELESRARPLRSGGGLPLGATTTPSQSRAGCSRGEPFKPPRDLNYDDEAKKLWSRLDDDSVGRRGARGKSEEPGSRGSMELNKLWNFLNLDPATISGEPYSPLDPLWRNPKTGGTFFVGNQMAASNLALLQKYGITHVVNCTDNMPNYHEGQSNIKYFRFDITSHYQRVHSEEQAVKFVQPMLHFVDGALAKGTNVMVHCLAGAHRAGTTGVISLMHFTGLPAREAIPIAKRCRPIIDPIGGFPQLIAFVEKGWQSSQRSGA